MDSKRLRILSTIYWAVLAVILDIGLACFYFLQDTPEYSIPTLVRIYAAYVVVGMVSHYLLERHIAKQENDNDPGN